MFRGLRRLFRFRLRIKAVYAEPNGPMYADWKIIDRKTGAVVLGEINMQSRRSAKKALRWWRKYGD